MLHGNCQGAQQASSRLWYFLPEELLPYCPQNGGMQGNPLICWERPSVPPLADQSTHTKIVAHHPSKEGVQ
jgi:hypothetical protein